MWCYLTRRWWVGVGRVEGSQAAWAVTPTGQVGTCSERNVQVRERPQITADARVKRGNTESSLGKTVAPRQQANKQCSGCINQSCAHLSSSWVHLTAAAHTPERGVTPVWESEARTTCAFPPTLCPAPSSSSAPSPVGQVRPGQVNPQTAFERRTRNPPAVSHPATFQCSGQIRPGIDRPAPTCCPEAGAFSLSCSKTCQSKSNVGGRAIPPLHQSRSAASRYSKICHETISFIQA